MNNWMANTLGPFLRKRGVIIVIVLFVVTAAVLLIAHVTTGPMPIYPWGP